MDTEHIEQVQEVIKPRSAGDSKLGEARNVRSTKGVRCLYFEERTCRAPYCDSQTCAKCPRGCMFCTSASPNPLKKLLHRVMGFIVIFAAFLFEESFIIDNMGKFFTRL